MAVGCYVMLSCVSRVVLVSTVLMVASAESHTRPTFCQFMQLADSGEKSFLWVLKDRVPPVYFFGTIHVPYTRVWSYIPENVKQAFQQADSVFFELDLIDPYTIAALAKCQMLPSGESLSDLLPRDVYQRLKRHLDYVKNMMPSWLPSDQRSRGFYADYLFNAIAGNWERKRPIWVMLMVNSLTENDIKTRGIPVLDLYLAQEAQRMDKRFGAVERVDEQCVPLNGLNFTQVLFALNQTLVQQENLRSGDPYPGFTTDDLIKHYNCGDLDSVYLYKESGQVPQFSNSSLPGQDGELAKNIDLYFKNELVHKRNSRMGERVLELIRNHPEQSFFFAFGAGHFLGNNSVLDYVTSKGFVIDQVAPDQKLRNTKKVLPQFRHRHKFHSHHHRNYGVFGETDVNNELHHFQSSRLSRRRYRKRQNHHHHYHGVRLLRTSTAASTKRTFNDLWVKMDDFTRHTSRNLAPSDLTDDTFDDTLRAWYGLQSSAWNVSSCRITSIRILYSLVFAWVLLKFLSQ